MNLSNVVEYKIKLGYYYNKFQTYETINDIEAYEFLDSLINAYAITIDEITGYLNILFLYRLEERRSILINSTKLFTVDDPKKEALWLLSCLYLSKTKILEFSNNLL